MEYINAAEPVKRQPASGIREYHHLLESFKTPWNIQVYLNSLPYNDTKTCRSPKVVVRDRRAHCAEGAYLAAAALRRMGFPPLVVDLAAENDDDHVTAVFRRDGLWGAVAKSNTTVLRYREPVYRSLRELVMSYFDLYFNSAGAKSLTGYSRPVNLSRYDIRGWETMEGSLEWIGDLLTAAFHYSVLPGGLELSPADPALVKACFLGAAEKGIYHPEERKHG